MILYNRLLRVFLAFHFWPVVRFVHVDARNACWTHLQTAMLFIILQHRQHSANLSVSISLWASKQQLHFWHTILTYMNELNELVPSYWVKLSLLSNLRISFPIKLLYTWVESSCLTFNCKSGVVFQRGGLTGMSMCRHIRARQAKGKPSPPYLMSCSLHVR